jgi:hypothetical protein
MLGGMGAFGPNQRDARERRSAPRVLEPRGVVCDKGAVGDISLSGLRVLSRCRWPEGHHDVVTVSDAERRVRVEVMCMWCREQQDGSHAVGLCFSGLSLHESSVLESILIAAQGRRSAAA